MQRASAGPLRRQKQTNPFITNHHHLHLSSHPTSYLSAPFTSHTSPQSCSRFLSTESPPLYYETLLTTLSEFASQYRPHPQHHRVPCLLISRRSGCEQYILYPFLAPARSLPVRPYLPQHPPHPYRSCFHYPHRSSSYRASSVPAATLPSSPTHTAHPTPSQPQHIGFASMATTVQAPSRPRVPLAELPLHPFVSQSLACSPSSAAENMLKTPSRSRSRSPSLPRSSRSSVSVSPHKQAVLQNHRLVREGSAASPSSAQPSILSDQLENATEAELSVLPRRLFGDRPTKHTSSDLSLEASPILQGSSSAESRFSPRNVKEFAHYSPSKPSTPKGATTTPLNARQHRPPHTAGPKPTNFVEPSPTTQRKSEPRGGASRRQEQDGDPSTPSRTRIQAPSPAKPVPDEQASATQAKEAIADGVTPQEETSRSISTLALQSLPKKKHRVSPLEVAIAHEEAGAGPIASPSPRKMHDYFSPPEEGATGTGFAQPRLRSDSISDKQTSAATLQDLTDLSSKPSIDSLTLARSGLFLGVVARPLPGWTVYEDPTVSSDTAPSQDHAVISPVASPVSSPMPSSAKHSVPSTPNKENRIPDATFLASKAVPVALPDRAYSVDAVPAKTRSPSSLSSAAPSPAAVASRKRGTGGRLSLLADAQDDDSTKDASLLLGDGDETLAAGVGSGKKVKSRGHAASANTSPAPGTRKASSHQRKASGGLGRTSRKGSSTHHAASPLDAVSLDAVALRTRSRTRA